MPSFSEVLQSKFAGLAALSPAQIELLLAHYELLNRWNRSLNLTSIRTLEEAVERHYCESLFAAIQLPEQGTIADIGSGAGFPGIPIAIMRPKCAVALIESHQRKAAFLKEASRGLRNVRVLARRAEDLLESFDWVVSRAVRYKDIAPTLRQLASNAELLTGEAQESEMPEFAWQQPILLPWGDHRHLWIGRSRFHVER
jgi:16S rRNA (guanine527-N7)-methyltransferase